MRIKKAYKDWSGKIVPEASLSDLDQEAIRSAKAIFISRHPGSTGSIYSWDNNKFLKYVHFTKDGKITNAALILLGKGGVGRILSQSICIKWSLIDTSGFIQDSRIFDGPMILTVRQVVSMIHNPSCSVNYKSHTHDVSTYRISTLIEAIHNAIVHQDYSYGGTINIIERECESITISNNGSFGGIPPEHFVAGHPNVKGLVNPSLFYIMSCVGMISGIQAGVRGIYLSQAYRHFPMPQYMIIGNMVILTIPGIRLGAYIQTLDSRDDLDISTIMDLSNISNGHFIAEKSVSKLLRLGLVSIESRILLITPYINSKPVFTKGTEKDAIVQMILNLGSISRSDVVSMLSMRNSKGISDYKIHTKATNLIQSMRRDGIIIKHSGNTKSARYILK